MPESNAINATVAKTPKWRLEQKTVLKIHAWTARGLALLFTVLSYLFATKSNYHPDGRFAPQALLGTGAQLALYNVGLWLSSTVWGAKHRILTCVLLLPSFKSALMASYYPGEIFCLCAMSFIFWSYWIVIKRRRL